MSEFEIINNSLSRIKVAGGYLYLYSYEYDCSHSMVFVPDAIRDSRIENT